MIGLYAITSRLRMLSSQDVVESAEKVARDRRDVRLWTICAGALLGHKLDLLRSFSEACRDENFSMGRRGWLRRSIDA